MADQKSFFDTELRLVVVLASITVWAAETSINSGVFVISVRMLRLGLRSEYNRPSPPYPESEVLRRTDRKG